MSKYRAIWHRNGQSVWNQSLPKHRANRQRSGQLGKVMPVLPVFMLLSLSLPRLASAEPIDGFTEPFRTIDVASAETGIITKILVREGEFVHRGQFLASLDVDVLQAHLAIAERESQSRGTLESARAEQRLRQDRLDKLQQLRAKGIARQEEVDRARTDLTIAEAQGVSAEDALAIKRLECKKIKVQIERRIVCAPIDGVVNAIHKEEGEHVSTADPQVVTLVQLDPLLAVFSMSASQTALLCAGQHVTVHPVRIAKNGSMDAIPVVGVVEFVSPVTHAESSTVLVTIRFDNSDGLFRSGEHCWLKLPDGSPPRKGR